MNVEVGKKYRHFKGKIVEVLLIAKDSENLTDKVIYKEENGTIWVRDYDMFISKIDKNKYPDIKDEYRFELID